MNFRVKIMLAKCSQDKKLLRAAMELRVRIISMVESGKTILIYQKDLRQCLLDILFQIKVLLKITWPSIPSCLIESPKERAERLGVSCVYGFCLMMQN